MIKVCVYFTQTQFLMHFAHEPAQFRSICPGFFDLEKPARSRPWFSALLSYGLARFQALQIFKLQQFLNYL